MGATDLIVAASDPSVAKICVTVVGAICELVGRGLVVLDVREARQAAREVTPTSRPAWLTGVSSSEEALPIEACGGRQPPLEERVEALEAAARRLEYEHGAATRELRREMYAHVGLAQKAALEHADERDLALRKFIANELTSGVGRSLAGVGLFGIGVVASAVSNLM